MGLVRVITDDNISWLEISMNIPLRMYTVKPIHKLQSYDYDRLYLELAFLE